MRSMIVVILHPFFSKGLDLAKVFKEVGIQNISPEASAETFDVRILRRFAWLNKLQDNWFLLAPETTSRGYKLRPIVNPDTIWLASPTQDLFQYPYDPLCG